MEAYQVIENAATALLPPPPLTVSEWADEYRYIASGKSPFPGKWSTNRTPYLREVLDCITDPTVEQIVIKKPTRIGGTEVINNAIGYHIHYDPCQILYVQTSLEEGRKYSDEILSPMIEATPILSARVAKERGRKATQTKLHKSFPGGNLAIVGAKSPKGFRMVSKRVVICDDVDGYEDNKEGDPVKLAIGRAKDYWNKKIVLISNPTTEGVSRIDAYYKLSDKRYRWVPCPRCDEYQVLKFGGKDHDYGLKWGDDPEEVWYLCEHCHEKIYEHEKKGMDLRGEYRAEAEFNGIAGFHFNPFLCAWHPWKDFRKEFLGSKGDPSKLYVFVTQWLGEVWKEDVGVRVDEDMLYARREIYPADVPMGAKLLTAAVDTQDDRLECVVMGWGPGEEAWVIEQQIFNGSPVEEKVWNALDNYLLRTFRHESGYQMEIKGVAVDTGGHHTAQVYAFTHSREGRGVMAVHGSNDPKADVLDGDVRINKGTGAKYRRVGASTCKDILAGRLRLSRPGHGYIHFPNPLDMEFFRQLLGEKPVISKSGIRRWQPVIGRRNEAMDLHNYNLAALRMLRPDWEAIELGRGEDMGRKVYKHHQTDRHLDDSITVKPEYPIVICCDFGKNPLVWMLAQTDGKRVWVFDEFAIRNGDTTQMAVQVQKQYGGHKRGLIVYGSATGTVRTSTGKSEYAILADYGLNRQRVKRMNPPDIDRVNAVNNMLENIAGEVRITYHSNCIMLRRDFDQCLWLEDMSDIDRTDFGRGNATDALGHFIVYKWPLRAARPNPNRRFWK